MAPREFGTSMGKGLGTGSWQELLKQIPPSTNQGQKLLSPLPPCPQAGRKKEELIGSRLEKEVIDN